MLLKLLISEHYLYCGLRYSAGIFRVVLQTMVLRHTSHSSEVFVRLTYSYIFIVGLEVLAIYTQTIKRINGLTLGKEVKVVIFLDDKTMFPKNKRSYHSLMRTLKTYSTCSGI